MSDQKKQDEEKDGKFPGYPHYKADEDIYRREEELEDIDPETGKKFQKAKDNIPGLDVPGSEDDDKLEDVGSEDEENNYYSLGGDDHDNLEENNDDFVEKS